MTAKTAARAALIAGLALLSGCTSTASPHSRASTPHRPAPDTGALTLAAATTCDELMAGLHAAARPYVGAFGSGYGIADAAPGGPVRGPVAAAPGAAAAAPGAKAAGPDSGDTPAYSGTNVAEAGVDEPDLVKTDGKRIVTVTDGVLRVVDAGTRQVTGTLRLADTPGMPDNLLLAGDRALVMVPWSGTGVEGPRLLLVELSGSPRILSSYAIDGALLDARQVGSTVRVVVHSAPRIAYPGPVPGDNKAQIAAAQAALDRTGPDQWLPRYEVTTNGKTTTGRVDCAKVRRPALYSGTSLLTLLTFDLGQPAFTDGDPVTIVADGQTVYATANSLYVANENQWMIWPRVGIAGDPITRPFTQQTDVYQFDISGTGTPAYVAAGSVPGWVINQYALSEWQGDLRIAATLNQATSTVTVLRRDGGTLRPVGSVGGLGKGERIYAVRFAGPVGYVVTFRQTDPLYTLDLRDPTRPAVTGELEIDGYSAYLHPAGNGRLIGVGQAANSQGRNLGLQVSLFDVTDPAKPSRLARYQLPGSGHSMAEFDPHAFLYWPATGLLVIPIRQDALALQVTNASVQPKGQLAAPAGQALRSLVIGTTVWTVSTTGLAAADVSSLAPQAWLPN